jgi:hypothetical protein
MTYIQIVWAYYQQIISENISKNWQFSNENSDSVTLTATKTRSCDYLTLH